MLEKVKFSVLLSVFHKEKPKFLDQALRSVWDNQTLKPDQIVLVKDGALTLELDDKIEKWKRYLGGKFSVVALEKNVGLGAALNLGLEYCCYELVARMDTDDVSLPLRFEEQLDFMVKNPNISVSSGFIEEWSEDLTDKLNLRMLPLSHEDTLKFSKRRSPISHPAAIFRKSHVIESGGYPDIYPEDYALWVRMLGQGHKIANIDSVIVKMRTGEAFYARRGLDFLKGELKVIKMQYDYKMINRAEYLAIAAGRAFLRLSPGFFKKFAYRYIR